MAGRTGQECPTQSLHTGREEIFLLLHLYFCFFSLSLDPQPPNPCFRLLPRTPLIPHIPGWLLQVPSNLSLLPSRGSLAPTSYTVAQERNLGLVAPKAVHALIPGACDYVSLHGRRDFAGVFKLRILRWLGYPGLFEWTLNVITRVLVRRQGRKQRERGQQRLDGCVLKMQEGLQAKERRWRLEDGKDKETDSPSEPWERTRSADTVTSPVRLISDFLALQL